MWLEHSKMLINEYRLDLMSPKAQQILREQVRAVLLRRGRAAAAGLRRRPRRSDAVVAASSSFHATSWGTSRCTWPRRWRSSRRRASRRARIDLAVEPLDEEAVRDARFVAIAVPMHTALRLGAEVGARGQGAQSARAPLLLRAVRAAQPRVPARAGRRLGRSAASTRRRCVELVARSRRGGPRRSVARSLDVRRAGARERCRRSIATRASRPPTASALAGYVEACRGCLHLCRHCPIPPVYGGRFFVVPVDVVLADVARARSPPAHATSPSAIPIS